MARLERFEGIADLHGAGDLPVLRFDDGVWKSERPA
jgi:hypothetical protein